MATTRKNVSKRSKKTAAPPTPEIPADATSDDVLRVSQGNRAKQVIAHLQEVATMIPGVATAQAAKGGNGGLVSNAFISKAATGITTWSFLQGVTSANPDTFREDLAFCDAFTPVADAAEGLAKGIRDLIASKRRAMSATASSVYDFIVAKAKESKDSQLTAFAKEMKKSRRRPRGKPVAETGADAAATTRSLAPPSATRTTERTTEKVSEPAVAPLPPQATAGAAPAD